VVSAAPYNQKSMKQPEREPLMTVPQVAKRLSLATSTIYQYCRRGLLPCVRVYGRLRFERSDVEHFIEEMKAEPGSYGGT